MSELSEPSGDMKNILRRLDEFLSEFEDIKFEASKLLQQFYYNQSEIDQLSSRLVSINELKRKYGGTLESVTQHKQKLKLLLDNSSNLEFLIDEKNNQKNLIKEKLKAIGFKLFDKRKSSIKKLSTQIKNDLQAMGMDKVDFFVDLGDFELNKIGIEKCIFYIRTNHGEDLATLGKIVSGGELSRIMMAIKLSINSCVERKLFILDEIDAGLSGKEADSIGNIIKTLSFKNQVVCITHLSQIASKADKHFKVYKEVVADRTNCTIETLDEKSKITELASMVSGQEITSESIDYARGMLGK
jgi:DNA repair protein RecN (Recombination protein N)